MERNGGNKMDWQCEKITLLDKLNEQCKKYNISNMKIHIPIEYTIGRESPTWYDGEILTFSYKHFDVFASAMGKISFWYDDDYYTDANAKVLIDLGINSDEDIKKAIENGRFEYVSENWFECKIKDRDSHLIIECLDGKDNLSSILNIDNYVDIIESDWKIENINNYVNVIDDKWRDK